MHDAFQPVRPLGAWDVDGMGQGEDHAAKAVGVEAETAEDQRGRDVRTHYAQVASAVGQHHQIARRHHQRSLSLRLDAQFAVRHDADVGGSGIKLQPLARPKRTGLHAVSGEPDLAEDVREQVWRGRLRGRQLGFWMIGQIFRQFDHGSNRGRSHIRPA